VTTQWNTQAATSTSQFVNQLPVACVSRGSTHVV
jgi:hypothetical protein